LVGYQYAEGVEFGYVSVSKDGDDAWNGLRFLDAYLLNGRMWELTSCDFRVKHIRYGHVGEEFRFSGDFPSTIPTYY
jgi:hypothetical protein